MNSKILTLFLFVMTIGLSKGKPMEGDQTSKSGTTPDSYLTYGDHDDYYYYYYYYYDDDDYHDDYYEECGYFYGDYEYYDPHEYYDDDHTRPPHDDTHDGSMDRDEFYAGAAPIAH